MTTELTLPSSPLAALMPLTPNKDAKHRIGRFIQWVQNSDQQWWNPDVAAYVAYLRGIHGLSNHSISTHLATIRSRVTVLLNNNKMREQLWIVATDIYPGEENIVKQETFVNEHLKRLENAFHPSQAGVKNVKKQDKADSEGLWLTVDQVQQLALAPGKDTLEGIRDTAILALMVCTGIRAAECANIKLDDLRQYYEGQLALRVTEGKGKKQRLIPYGGMSWCLEHVQDWLNAAAIKSGYVFRGFFRGGKLRSTPLSTRAIEKIFEKYPLIVSGLHIQVNPHATRKSYARNGYNAGMSAEALQQNLGHENLKTTFDNYIGDLSAEHRTPGTIIENPYQAEAS